MMSWHHHHLRLLVASLLLGSTISVGADTEVATNDLSTKPAPIVTLRDKKWIHGSADCKTNDDPVIEVFQYDQSSYILRQNKCLSYEAPFIYVLVGAEKVLILDTGATESSLDFPLYETVRTLVATGTGGAPEMLVVHSHGHSDHHAGDVQFEGKPNVTIVEATAAAVSEFFGFSDWPDGQAELELGNRKLAIIPTPGHQEESIAIFDPHTKWLLTGDTFYPGLVCVKNWGDYRKSIARLVSLSKVYSISAILGAHIEMTAEPGKHYSIGSTYQPNEASLSLTPANLASLYSALEQSDEAREIVLEKLIVVPMNAIQKVISNISRWIVQ